MTTRQSRSDHDENASASNRQTTGQSPDAADTTHGGTEERLDSWKEIAGYLKTSVRTVQRWEKTEGLPVRRQLHAALGSVYAYRSELESWRRERSTVPGKTGGAQARAAGATVSGAPASSVQPMASWEAELQAVRAELGHVAWSDGTDRASDAASRPTVGRARELAAMVAAFEAARDGRCLFLCVGGDAGIGKTTLVEAFLADLAQRGETFITARGRCSERLAGSEAYLPLLEALESLTEGAGGRAASGLMKLVAPAWYVRVAPLWAASDPTFAPVVSQAKEASRERIKRELGALVEELTRIRPLVVFLDDVHWADASTIELLAYLAKSFADRPLLIVAAVRTTDMMLADHPFLAVKRDLQLRGICRDLEVGLLGPDDARAYVDAEYAGHAFPDDFARFVHARTEGNPLFMVDLLRDLESRGVLTQADGCWALGSSLASFEAELPASVRSMVERKVAQLDDADRRLLVTASVQGNEFDSAVVAEAAGMDAADVEQRLDRLHRVHCFVRPLPDRPLPDATISMRYRFVHALYQAALQSSLTPTQRAAASGAVARSLVAHHGDAAASIAADLAVLFETARDFEAASRHYFDAARRAARMSANHEAVRLLARSLANAEKLDGEARQARILPAAAIQAQLQQTIGRFDESAATCRLAERTAVEAGDEAARVEAVCGLANALFLNKQIHASSLEGRRALALARRNDSAVGVATAEAVLARERLCVGDLDAAELRYERAMPVLTRHGYTRAAMEAVGFRMLMHGWRLDYAGAERASSWWKQHARDASGQITSIFFFHSGMCLGNRGQMQEALNLTQEGIRKTELNDDTYYLCRLANILGWLCRELQDVESAVRWDTESIRLSRESQSEEAEANAHVNLAHDSMALGQLDHALEHLRTAEKLFENDDWFRWRYHMRMQAELASYWMRRGDVDSARACALSSVECARGSLSRKHMAWGHKLLGDIAALEDEPGDAMREYRAAATILHRHPCPPIQWKIASAWADAADRLREDGLADRLRARAKRTLDALASTVEDDHLRAKFLGAPAVRALRRDG